MVKKMRWPDEGRRASGKGKNGEDVHVWDARQHAGDKRFAEFVHDKDQTGGGKTAERFDRENVEREFIKKKMGT